MSQILWHFFQNPTINHTQAIFVTIGTIGKTAEKTPHSDKIPREQFLKKFKYFSSYFILHKTPNTWTLGVTADKIHEKSLKPAEFLKKIAEFN